MSKSLQILGQSSPTAAANGADGITAANSFRGRVALVTFGCAKNHVDSEVMLGVLQKEGFELVNEVERADIAIVNTCGFLESALTESVDGILSLAQLKESGSLRRLVVAGCAVERYGQELEQEMPEVDAFVSTDNLLQIGKAAGGELSKIFDAGSRPYFLYDESTPRVFSGGSHSAYIKISEGCNRPCTFCIIPRIRGSFRSRSIESVTQEAVQLASRGVREVNLIAQDLTSFGTDQRENGKSSVRLIKLLESMNAETELDWIRLLYAYPIGTDEALLRAIVDLPRVCNYLDLPLQHSSESVLKRMKRPIGRYSARSVVELIARTAPEIALRTTFIVGFPGETESDIRDLEQLVSEGHFSNLGVFTYSPERGTPAAEMDGQIAAEERELRRERIMAAQQVVVQARNEALIGSQMRVLVDGPHEDTDLLLSARSEFQAPEVDGVVIINDVEGDTGLPSVGEFVNVEVRDTAGYDLVGCVLSSSLNH